MPPALKYDWNLVHMHFAVNGKWQYRTTISKDSRSGFSMDTILLNHGQSYKADTFIARNINQILLTCFA